MHTVRIRTTLLFLLLLTIALLIAACGAIQDAFADEIPLVPLEYVTSGDGVAPWRAALHVRDRQMQLFQYGPTGEYLTQSFESYDVVTFPTDVLVVYSEADGAISVFLRRSPHGGCLLLWDPESSRIHDPCFGSRYDRNGVYLGGLTTRNLDRLPASVRDGMIWAGSEVIYGDLNQ